MICSLIEETTLAAQWRLQERTSQSGRALRQLPDMRTASTGRLAARATEGMSRLRGGPRYLDDTVKTLPMVRMRQKGPARLLLMRTSRVHAPLDGCRLSGEQLGAFMPSSRRRGLLAG